MEALIKIRQPLFTQVCLCLESSHSELAATAVRILDHPGVFFPFILFPKEIRPGVGPVDTDSHAILGIIIHAFDKIGADHAYLDIRKTIETLKRLVMDKHGQAICEQKAMAVTNKANIIDQRNIQYENLEEPNFRRSPLSSPTGLERKRDGKRKPTMPLTQEQQAGTRQRKDSLGEDDFGDFGDVHEEKQKQKQGDTLALPTSGRKHKAASISGGTIDLKMLELIAGLDNDKKEQQKGVERRRSKILLAAPLPIASFNTDQRTDTIKGLLTKAGFQDTFETEEEEQTAPSELELEDLGEDGEIAVKELQRLSLIVSDRSRCISIPENKEEF